MGLELSRSDLVETVSAKSVKETRLPDSRVSYSSVADQTATSVFFPVCSYIDRCHV